MFFSIIVLFLILHAESYVNEENNEIDVFLVPRVNTVSNITPEHIQKWGWKVNDEGWVNWPDMQWRLWKNKPEIKLINKTPMPIE